MPERNLPLISLFTGAGGLDLGLEMAGFDTRACVEIDATCCETLKLNRPHWSVIQRDISSVSVEELLKVSDLEVGQAALVSAGPPCQSFSNIGNRKGMKDPRGRLFHEFVRMLKGIRPRAFIMENVPGLLNSQKGKVMEIAISEFERIGYTVHYGVLNAADYETPQVRKRLFFLGSRESIKFEFPRPTHSKNPLNGEKPWVTVGEALFLLSEENRNREDNKGFKHSPEMIEKMRLIPPGKNFKILPDALKPNCWKNGSHQGQDTFGRLEMGKPAVTIRTAAYNPTKGRYIHPLENRGLTTLEMAVLQSFPKEYRFVGTLCEIGTQIGNAVPPLLAKAIGIKLKEQLTEVPLQISPIG